VSVGWPTLSLEVELPKWQRNLAPTAEITEVIELAAREAVGAVGSDYWFGVGPLG